MHYGIWAGSITTAENEEAVRDQAAPLAPCWFGETQPFVALGNHMDLKGRAEASV